MARTKVKLECRLKSWSEVDDSMKQVSECERVMDELTTDMNTELDRVKARYAEMAKPVQERIDQQSADICQFVTEHRSEMDGKTRELNFGRTGFRISTKLKYNKGIKAADVVAALVKLRLTDCVKTTQAVIADRLKAQPLEVLDTVGAYLDRRDEFWFETKRDTIQPAKEAQEAAS